MSRWGALNLPDDWGDYFRRCGECGSRYHASEGGCGCRDDWEECHGDSECLIDPGEVTQWVGALPFCEDHLGCCMCGDGEGNTPEAEYGDLKDFDGEVYCRQCYVSNGDEEDWEAKQ